MIVMSVCLSCGRLFSDCLRDGATMRQIRQLLVTLFILIALSLLAGILEAACIKAQ